MCVCGVIGVSVQSGFRCWASKKSISTHYNNTNAVTTGLPTVTNARRAPLDLVKLSSSLKRLKERNYERNYWVNTLMPLIFGAARDDNQHPVWNYLYQERKILLIPLLPTLGHDLPYHKSTMNTKLKEPCVLLTKKSYSALRWPAGKKPEMNFRECLHKYDIVPWL